MLLFLLSFHFSSPNPRMFSFVTLSQSPPNYCATRPPPTTAVLPPGFRSIFGCALSVSLPHFIRRRRSVCVAWATSVSIRSDDRIFPFNAFSLLRFAFYSSPTPSQSLPLALELLPDRHPLAVEIFSVLFRLSQYYALRHYGAGRHTDK